MRARDLAPLEAEEQATYFEWWALFARTHRLPEQLCFAVPNGGHRHPAVARKLKAQGVRAGVPDVHLDIPAGGFHGLRLEFKRVGEDVRNGSAQEAHIDALRRRGYNAMVVKSATEAVHLTKVYLSRADLQEDRVPMRS